MKTLRQIFTVIWMVSVVLLTNCSDDDNNDEGDGVFTAKYDGTNFTADRDEAKAVLTKGVGGSPDLISFTVRGLDDDTDRMIYFSVFDYDTPGTYSLTVASSNSAYYYENYVVGDEDEADVWISPDYSNLDEEMIHGTITVTEVSTSRAKGTFQFAAYQVGGVTKHITEGAFDVPVTRQGF